MHCTCDAMQYAAMQYNGMGDNGMDCNVILWRGMNWYDCMILYISCKTNRQDSNRLDADDASMFDRGALPVASSPSTSAGDGATLGLQGY